MGGGTSYWSLNGSRIANTTRQDMSGADDANVSIALGDDFIVAARCFTSKGPLDRSVSLYWRDVTDIGTFALLSATGELKYTANTDLTDGSPVTSGQVLCSNVVGYTYQNGLHCEDGIAGSVNLQDEYQTELQFGVSAADADADHLYEFELYDETMGAQIPTSVLGAQVNVVTPVTGAITGALTNLTGESAALIPDIHLGAITGNLQATESLLVQKQISVADIWDTAKTHASALITRAYVPGDTLWTNTSGVKVGKSLVGVSSGKVYVEFIYAGAKGSGSTSHRLSCGICDQYHTQTGYIGAASQKGWGIYANTSAGSWSYYLYHEASGTLAGSTTGHGADGGHVIQFAIDIDAGKIWLGVDNVYNGDPAAGTGEDFQDDDIFSATMYLAGYVSLNQNINTEWTIRCKHADQTYAYPDGTLTFDKEFTTIGPEGYVYEPWNHYDRGSQYTYVRHIGRYGNVLNQRATSSTWYNWARSEAHQDDGRLYMEFKVYSEEVGNQYLGFGICLVTASLGSSNPGVGGRWCFLVYEQSGDLKVSTYTQTSQSLLTTLVSVGLETGQTWMMAVDLDEGKLWIGLDGTWLTTGDPENGTGEHISYTPVGSELYITGATKWYDIATDINCNILMVPPTDHAYSPPAGFPVSFGARTPSTYTREVSGGFGGAHLDADGDTGIYYGNRYEGSITASLQATMDDKGGQHFEYVGPSPREQWNPSDCHASIDVTGTYDEFLDRNTDEPGLASCRSLNSNSSGKWYVEFRVWDNGESDPITYIHFGLGTSSANLAGVVGGPSHGTWGCSGTTFAGQPNRTDLDGWYDGDDTFITDQDNGISGSMRFQMAVDLDAGKIWFGLDDDWGSGDPGAGTGETFSGLTGSLFLMGQVVGSDGNHIQGDIKMIAAPNEQSYNPPTDFIPGWIEGAPTTDIEMLHQKLGLPYTITAAVSSTYEEEIIGNLGLNDHIYEGTGTEYLCDISGNVLAEAGYTEGGSLYHTNIVGDLKSGSIDEGKWDWEDTLFRYLDDRHTRLSLGAYIKVSLLGEAYFLYNEHASRTYVLTVTGVGGPIEIPITEFRAVLRDGIESNLAVVISGEYVDEIIARQAGTLTIEVVWLYAGEEINREDLLLNIPIDKVSYTIGSHNTDIRIYGSGLTNYPGQKTVEMTDIQYMSSQDGKLRYRSSYIHGLEPGDIIASTGQRSFVAGEVTLTVSITPTGSVQETFEVGEELVA